MKHPFLDIDLPDEPAPQPQPIPSPQPASPLDALKIGQEERHLELEPVERFDSIEDANNAIHHPDYHRVAAVRRAIDSMREATYSYFSNWRRAAEESSNQRED